TTTVVSSGSPSVVGQGVTFTATVAPIAPGTGTPTGQVIFTVDGSDQPAVTLAGGQAFLTLSTLPPGPRTITARYLGDPQYVQSQTTGAPLVQQVNMAGTTTTVAATPAPSVFGQPVTLTATVAAASPGSGTPTGNVVFNIDGQDQAPV